MNRLFLNKDLVTGSTLTQDGVLAYVALRIIIDESVPLYNKSTSTDCISVNRLAYSLMDDMDYEKALTDALVRGIVELAGDKWISIRKDFSTKGSYEYVLDVSNLYLDTEKDKFVIVSLDEVYKIMTCKEKMEKRIRMLKYYIALVSTFDWSLNSKIGHMSQEYIAEQADNSVKTCRRYNKILQEMEMIYIYKSNDKVRVNDRLKQIKNCYSRYEDKSICEEYASNYENMYGVEHKIVKTQKNKAQADTNRRLGAIYNQICFGNTDYDKETIKAVYEYVVNKNKALQKEIDSKYAQTYMTDSDKAWVEKLESQIRETSIFDQFDFLKNDVSKSGNTDYWGEPDPLEPDFSVEEMLDMPILGEVQSEPCNLQSEGGKVTNSDLDIETDAVGLDDDNILPWMTEKKSDLIDIDNLLVSDDEFADLY